MFFFLKNRAFFKGCVIRRAYPEIGERWVKILQKLGVNTISIPTERCCGSPLRNAGAGEEFEENAKMLKDVLNKYHIYEVITACPACAHTISKHLKIPAKHVTQVVAEKMGKKKITAVGTTVAFHDPCHLARYLDGATEARKILEIVGCKVVEPAFAGQFTYCCGGGGGLPANHPKIAGKITKERVRQLESSGVEMIVTSCPMCLHQIKRYSKTPVVDLSEIVARAMGVEE